jgi:DNA repair exonuclease SbcCD ATPase subunit
LQNVSPRMSNLPDLPADPAQERIAAMTKRLALWVGDPSLPSGVSPLLLEAAGELTAQAERLAQVTVERDAFANANAIIEAALHVAQDDAQANWQSIKRLKAQLSVQEERTGEWHRACEAAEAKLAQVEQALRSVSGQLRSAVQLSRQFKTPAADHELLLGWADELAAALAGPKEKSDV